ncbi:MAG: sugar transferase, partial [Calditrichia bacterium]
LFEYAPRKTLIIGCNELSQRILKDIEENPHLIFDIAGFVSNDRRLRKFHGYPVMGQYAALPGLIHQHKIQEVLIALPESDSEGFIKVVSLCEAQNVKIKIPPSSHEIFAGSQPGLASHSYLEIFPSRMVIWQWMMKRLFDIVFAVFILILTSPFMIFSAVYLGIRFRKNPIITVPILGKNGIPFNMYALRITPENYDYEKNPVYLGIGSPEKKPAGILKIYHSFRLFKLPELANVLLGDMSIVGPRPEPVEWYEKYKYVLKFFQHRISVRPGITGLAQVKYHYETSQKILQERIKYDIFYIENLSLRMDARVILRSLWISLRRPLKYSASAKESLPKNGTYSG